MTKVKFVSGIAALLIGFAAAGVSTSQAQPRNLWGAVAYGPNGAWAYSVNHWSRRQAQNAALRRCRGRCSRTLTFYNTCGAYAVGARAYGWATRRNKYAAQNVAMRQCSRRTYGCRVRVWACTSRY